jgi:D-alanine-D-alanine ligase
MRIGITYDLREDYARKGYDEEEAAEFDSVETVDAIELALSSLGHSTDRIGHARELTRRLVQGDRWDMVFNIAEGLHGFGREALVPALLDAYEIPYTFSDPLALSVALHKGTAKRVVRDLGIRTADFEVIEDLDDVEGVDLAFPLFIKPIAEGASKGISGISKVRNRFELRSGCERLLARFRQPVLVETFLPGREFCVGILGTGRAGHALGVMEIVLKEEAEPEIYSYVNKKDCQRVVQYSLAAGAAAVEARQMALDVWIGLGCRDGGRVELRCDASGRMNFIEANPLTGLQADSDLVMLGSLTGVSYVELIERIVASASSRARARPAVAGASGSAR